ncbi:hypothetical protein EOPP23_07205 [Endozoicomonas sp. OPT23]|uniref:hypothetical protein n=1 Tax=Endozoicomonas sp. OPT23 TaxID=2072845 RepID=UPI00129AD925|nr:hypothetical protein [Endozoicomonas sp. OPT23]MRI32769.1 hypothetical protein [Endozoicomonas sp. OPT23]
MEGIILASEKNRTVVVCFLASGFLGWSGASFSEEQPLIGIDGEACVGHIQKVPQGLTPIADEAVLTEALGSSGLGKLCSGQTYIVTEPLLVYRVWNSTKSYTVYGQWWSLDVPDGPREEYREENAICPSWSPLDVYSYCTVKPGTRIVIGPGQSATCRNVTYGKSPVNQVYIPNNGLENIIYVENCSQAESWP